MKFKNDMKLINSEYRKYSIHEVPKVFEKIYPGDTYSLVTWCNMLGLYCVKHVSKRKSILVTLRDLAGMENTYVFAKTIHGLECKGELQRR